MAARDPLTVFVEDLLPSDDGPGAAEAGTADAVRAALAERPSLAALTEAGLRALDRASERLGGQPFVGLTPAQRHELMARVARGSPPAGWTATDPPPEVFWATVRGLAAALFYGGPLGRQVTGFPGACVDDGGHVHTIEEPDPLRGRA